MRNEKTKKTASAAGGASCSDTDRLWARDLLSTERADSGSEVTAAYTMTESQITDQAPTAVSVLDVQVFR